MAKNQEVVTTNEQAVVQHSARRAEMVRAHAGKGVSKNQDDKIIPMIRVLQAQSPQCLKQKAEFIPGAEAGDFYMPNTPQPLVKGEEGLRVQSCAFKTCWLEFDGPRDQRPNFVRRHDVGADGRPDGVVGLELDADGFDYVDPRGHRYTFSREHYVLVNGRLPFLLPFGGSGHSVSRGWQTLMDQFRLDDGSVEPSWNRRYRLTTVPRSNDSGDWFAIRVEVDGEGDASLVSDAEFDRGLQFYEAVMGGEVQGEAPPTAAAASAGASAEPF